MPQVVEAAAGRPGTVSRAARYARSIAHGPAGRPSSFVTTAVLSAAATAAESMSASSPGIGTGVRFVSDFNGHCTAGVTMPA